MSALGSVANMTYLPGFEERPWRGSLGAGIKYAWAHAHVKAALDYAYAFDAIRGGRRGGHAVALSAQWNLRLWAGERR